MIRPDAIKYSILTEEEKRAVRKEFDDYNFDLYRQGVLPSYGPFVVEWRYIAAARVKRRRLRWERATSWVKGWFR